MLVLPRSCLQSFVCHRKPNWKEASSEEEVSGRMVRERMPCRRGRSSGRATSSRGPAHLTYTTIAAVFTVIDVWELLRCRPANLWKVEGPTMASQAYLRLALSSSHCAIPEKIWASMPIFLCYSPGSRTRMKMACLGHLQCRIPWITKGEFPWCKKEVCLRLSRKNVGFWTKVRGLWGRPQAKG